MVREYTNHGEVKRKFTVSSLSFSFFFSTLNHLNAIVVNVNIKTLFGLFFFLLPQYCGAQNYSTAGGFTVRNFGVKNYGMHPRNFNIAENKKGVLYFGNAYGVIEYDGNTWRNIPLPNGNSGLSLGLAANGNIYVGSDNELGLLTTNNIGSTVYQSLSSKLPKAESTIGGVEQVLANDDQIIYTTFGGLYLYDEQNIRVIKPSLKGSYFQFSKKINGKIYIQESTKGLLILRRGALQLTPGGTYFKNGTVKDMLPLNENKLLVLKEDGLFMFDHATLVPLNEITNQHLKKSHLTHALRLQNENYLITTSDNGFYIVNPFGVILKHVSVNNGLQSNTINDAYLDSKGGLWLALDNGITYVEINTPFSFIGSTSGIMGMGYTAALFNGKLYVGTSQGLFYTPWENEHAEHVFKPVVNIKGQIWNLSILENTLLCCQNENTFQINNTVAHKITGQYDFEGHWKIAPLKDRPGYAIKGTYEGFQLYRLEKGQWLFSHKIKGFAESCRTFTQDEQGNIWMCHGNKGLYKIIISDDLQSITTAVNYSTLKGYAPDFFNETTLIDNHVVFSADDGPYLFDSTKDTFVKYTALEQKIGKGKYLNKLIQDQHGSIWVFSGNDIFLYEANSTENNTAQNVLKKITGELVGSYEFVMPIDERIAIIGAQEGFIFFNVKEKHRATNSYATLLRKIEASYLKDTLLFGGNAIDSSVSSNVHTWDYSLNSLRFSYAALCYENSEKLKYQYALSRKNDAEIHWSNWTSNAQVEFSNLWEGDYVFSVRSKNSYDELSQEDHFSFTLLPPWYRSLFAYACYLLVLLLLSVLFYKYIKTRFRKQKEKLTREKQKELLIQEQNHWTEKLQTEKELIGLRNEKLEAEMVLKNNELASMATTITQKTEFLAHLKDKLEIIHKDSDHAENDVFKEVIKTIDQDLDFDDNWANFQVHFDKLHHNFLHRLRNQYPKLNPSWLLLCAYIRMNKSNKEIAAHMNISVAGVEKRKYRLREKIGLDAEEKLSVFIVNF